VNNHPSPLHIKSSLSAALLLTSSIFACVVSTSCWAAINPSSMPSAILPETKDLIAKAQQAMKQGHPEVAIIYLKNAETVAPNVAVLHLDLGQALLAVNNPAEAERELNIALQKGVTSNRVIPLLLQTLLAQHQAQRLLDQYTAPNQNDRSPLATDILRARALAFIQVGKNGDAAASLDRAISIERTPQNLAARAQLALNMGDSLQATKLVDEALAKAPANAAVLMMKIAMMQRGNQANKALPYADALAKATNNGPLAMVTRAGVYLQLKQNALASTDLDKALTAAPNLPAAVFYKALIKAQTKDAKGAWALAQTLPRAYLPSRADIGMAVGQMAIDAGQVETGIDILHTTVQTYPTNVDARLRLANAYISKNEFSAAQDTLSSLQNSSDPRPSALLARLYAKQNNAVESAKYLQKANKLGFGGDALTLQLAARSLQKGDLDSAQKALQELNAKQPNRLEVVGPLIAVYLRKKDFVDATKLANEISSALPKNPYGPQYLGQIAFQENNIDGSIAAFTAALARDPKFVPAIYDRATMSITKGEYADAQKDLQTILVIDPKNSTAAVRLAQLYGQTGQGDKAVALLKKTTSLSPKDLSITSALVQYYADHNRLADAAVAVGVFLHSSPNNASAQALQANIQLASGATDAALGTYTRLTKAYPNSQVLTMMLARAYSKKGDNRSARATLLKAIASNPNSSEPYLGLVQQDLLVKDQTAALTDARNFADKIAGPTSALLLASLLVELKRSDEAETILRKNLVMFPDTKTVIQLSALLKRDGKSKASDAVLTTWLSQRSGDADVRVAYGVSLMAHDNGKAEQQFRIVLAEHPYNLTALNNLAWLLRDKDKKSAATYSTRALKLAPNMPSILDTNGWIKWQSNDKSSALQLLERAHNGAPTDPEIGYHLAVALAGSNRVDDARKVLNPILHSGVPFDDRDKAVQMNARMH
jgi:putative PEP-CTERM system TPR-repeat lipoprotein